MLVTRLVFETRPGKAHAVAECLARVQPLGSLVEDTDHSLFGTWRMPDDETLMGIPEVLYAVSPEIVEVHALRLPPRFPR